MHWFLNLGLRGKLFASFGLMIVLLAAVIWTGYLGVTAIQKSQKNLYESEFANATDLLSLRSGLNRTRAALLHMLLAERRSEQDAWERDIGNRAAENDRILQALLARNGGDPAFLAKVRELHGALGAYRESRDRQIALIHEGKTGEAKALAFGPQMERYEKLRAIAVELGEAANARAREAVLRSERQLQQTLLGLLSGGVLSLLAGVALTLSLSRSTANPLLEGAGALAAAVSEILATATQLAAGATETASAVSETSTTVEEVKQTAQLAAEKARQVSDTAQKAAQISEAGRKSADDTLAAMRGIHDQMASIAESIVRLSEQTQAIGEILATVNDLAEQSNMLAVNASIEAAKAGEQGKGFAVVAQEVKSLAEQSKQATAQVRGILNDIQKATGGVVMATEQGSRAVETGVRLTAEAGESIRSLAEIIALAAQAAMQIAASSQQQRVGMDQVALAVGNIREASLQNMAGARQSEAAAHDLNELGRNLRRLVAGAAA